MRGCVFIMENNRKFCRNCGEKLEEDDQFCTSCGKSLKNGKNRHKQVFTKLIMIILVIIVLGAIAFTTLQNPSNNDDIVNSDGNTTKISSGIVEINGLKFNIPEGYEYTIPDDGSSFYLFTDPSAEVSNYMDGIGVQVFDNTSFVAEKNRIESYAWESMDGEINGYLGLIFHDRSNMGFLYETNGKIVIINVWGNLFDNWEEEIGKIIGT
jgi:predicted nucleic acid-binding Zn ribbon protein